MATVTGNLGLNETLTGTSSRDRIYGDTRGYLISVGGNDTIIALDGDDYIYGDAYRDITGAGARGGDDDIDGGIGNDTIYGDGNYDLAAGALGGNDTISGGANDDILTGDVRDEIIGVNSQGGIDTIMGGIGNDHIFGDARNDIINGASGGNDFLYGEDDADRIYGDAGDDLINLATGGNDTISGGNGDDLIAGDAADDIADNSSGGDDNIDGGIGNDVLYGDAGGNILNGSNGGNDTILGGLGDDRIFGDAGEDLNLSAQGGDDLLLSGGDNNDLISGDAGNELKNGSTGGDDYIQGNAGDDQLYGDAVDSFLILAIGGIDTIEGGDGADIISGDAGGSFYDRSQGGNDIINAGPETTGNANTIYGDAGNTIYLMSHGGGDQITGSAVVDFIYGDAGIDIYGDSSGGNDTIYALAGDDVISGDAGRSLYDNAIGGADIIFAGAGNDTVYGDAGLLIRAGAQAGHDEIHGGDNDDTISGDAGHKLYENAIGGNDRLFGDTGNDIIVGDTLEYITTGGQGGNDIISGGDDDDILYGDARRFVSSTGFGGDDRLQGDAGNDYVYGNEGNDIAFYDWDLNNNGFSYSDDYSGGAGTDTLVLLFTTNSDVANIELALQAYSLFLAGAPSATTVFNFNPYGFDLRASGFELLATAPLAQDDGFSITHEEVLTGSGLFSNDINPGLLTAVNGQSLNVGTTLTLASGALLTVRADGTFDFDPNNAYAAVAPGQTVTETFTYTVENGQTNLLGDSLTSTASATLSITVEEVVLNQQPTAVNDNQTTLSYLLQSQEGYTPETTVSIFHGSVDLDFSGEFIYAVAASGAITDLPPSNPLIIGDAVFTADPIDNPNTPGLSMAATFEVDNWGSPNFDNGDGGTRAGAEEALEVIMSSTRWTTSSSDLTIDMEVTEGEFYKLQLFFYSYNSTVEEFDIIIDNNVILSAFNPLNEQGGLKSPATYTDDGVVVTYIYRAPDEITNIRLDATNSNNTMISGFTLEKLNNQANVLNNDIELDPLQSLVVTDINDGVIRGTDVTFTAASGAIVELQSNGHFFYNPNGQFDYLGLDNLGMPETATDSFNYSISDQNGGTDTASVTVTIYGINDAPTVVGGPVIANLTDADDDDDPAFTTPISIDLLAGTIDVDQGDNLSVSNLDFERVGSNVGEISVFANSSDLDFSGDFVYAIVFAGIDADLPPAASLLIGDANFTRDLSSSNQQATPGFSIDLAGLNTENNWGPANFDNGDGGTRAGAEGDLEIIMSSIRWTAPGDSIVLNIDVVSGETYKLQLLFMDYQVSPLDQFDVTVEGNLIAADFAPIDYQGGVNYNTGVVLTYVYTAEDAITTVEIASDVGANAIIQGLTLEKLPAVDAGLSFNPITNALDYDPHGYDYLGVNDPDEIITVSYDISDNHGASVSQTATITLSGVNDVPVAVNDSFDYPAGATAEFPTVGLFDAVVKPFYSSADLDFSGDIVYAISASGAAAELPPNNVVVIGDASFTADPLSGLSTTAGVSMGAANQVISWGDPDFDGGGAVGSGTGAEGALEIVMSSIRWTANPTPLTIDLDVEQYSYYKLQMLFYSYDTAIEAFDITIDGVTPARTEAFYPLIEQGGLNANVRETNKGMVVTYYYQALDEETNIVLNPVNGHNTMINGFTLEKLDSVYQLFDNRYDLLANDVELDVSDVLTVTSITDESGNITTDFTNPIALFKTGSIASGQVTMNADGSFLFDDNGDFATLPVGSTETVSFSYTVSDGNGGVDTAIATITIAGTEKIPAANHDTFSFSEDSGTLPAVATFRSTFTGSDVGEGLDLNGNFAYALNLGGSDTGILSAGNDAIFTTAVVGVGGVVLLTPNVSTNDWTTPDFDDPSDGFASGDEALLENIMADATTSNSAVEPITLTLDVLPNHIYQMQLMLVNRSNSARDFDFHLDGELVTTVLGSSYATISSTPTIGDLLTHTFVTDVAQATFTFTPPGTGTFVFVQGFTLEDLGVLATGNLLANDTDSQGGNNISVTTIIDADGNSTTLSASLSEITLFDAGIAQGRIFIDETGAFSYTADAKFEALAVDGSDSVSFDYIIQEVAGGTSQASVTLIIDGENDAPTVETVNLMLNEDDGPVVINFEGADVDDDNNRSDLTYTIIEQLSSGEGTVTNLNNSTFEYDPNANVDFQGLAVGETTTVTFTYQATDTHGATSGGGVVTITVTGVNDEPDVLGESFSMNANFSSVFTSTTQRSTFRGSDIGEGLDLNGNFAYALNLGGSDIGQLSIGNDAVFTTTSVNGVSITPNVSLDNLTTPDFDVPSDGFGVGDEALLEQIMADATTSNSGVDPLTITLDVDPETVYKLQLMLLNHQGDDRDFDFLVDGDFVIQVDGGSYASIGTSPNIGDLLTHTFLTDPGQTQVTFTFAPVGGFRFTNLQALTLEALPVASIIGNVLANDSDIDGDPLKVTTITDIDGNTTTITATASKISLYSGSQVYGELVIDDSGQFSFSSAGAYDDLVSGQSAVVSFAYEVSDGNSPAKSATASFTISGVNDAPTLILEPGLDLFVANNGQLNQVFTNDGNGNFTDSLLPFAGLTYTSIDVELGDIDGDGDLDALVISNSTGELEEIWYNDGSGDFPDVDRSTLSIGGDPTLSVALGDVDLDGDLDVFLGSAGRSSFRLNNGDGTFTTTTTFSNGQHSTAAMMRDIDNDGVVELIEIRDNNTDVIYTYDANSHTFVLKQNLANSSINASNNFDMADLNGDGLLDIFITKSGTIGNRVYLNDGAGNNYLFSDTNQTLGTSDSQGVALGDLDNDGDIDAFVVNLNSGNTVWWNNGSGFFLDSGLSLGTSASHSVVLADLNEDGFLDAFVANDGQANNLWLNDRNGGFVLSAGIGSENSVAVAVGQIDEPHHQLNEFTANNTVVTRISAYDPDTSDVLTYSITGGSGQSAFAINPTTGVISVLDNSLFDYEVNTELTIDVTVTDSGGLSDTETLTFSIRDINEAPTLTGGIFTIDEEPNNGLIVGSVSVTDPDNIDEHSFSIASGSDAFRIDALTGQIVVVDRTLIDYETVPGMSFTLIIQVEDKGGLTDTANVTINLNDVVEVNSAPRLIAQPGLDLFVANYGESNQVYLNDGNANFIDSALPFAGLTYTSIDVELGDIDGDGDLDALVISNSTGELEEIWYNDGSGNFPDADRSTLSIGGDPTVSVALGDVDLDGDLDVFLGSTGRSSFRINNGDGTFTETTVFANNQHSTAAMMRDIDNDGVVELIEIRQNNTDVVYSFNATTQTFVFMQNLANSNTGSSNNFDMADLNGDGLLDIFITKPGTTGNRVYLNDGAANSYLFTDTNQALGTSDSQAVALGDLDNDGDIDAFVANYNSGNTVWWNDGTGQFSSSGLSLGQYASHEVKLGDYDQDGFLDAFVVNANGQGNILWLNDNNGGFYIGRPFLGNANSYSVDVGQLDSASAILFEHALTNTVVTQVAGYDIDLGDSLTFSILNPTGAYQIDASTGVITVADPSLVDFENSNSFSIEVQVQDLAGLTDSGFVDLLLYNINEVIGDGNDNASLIGTSGRDIIEGLAGADTLFGDDDVDILIGGEGDDTLTGGNGADIFSALDSLTTGNGNDDITDWQDGLDVMDFTGHIGVNGLGDVTITTTATDTTVSYSDGGFELLGYTGGLDSSDFLF